VKNLSKNKTLDFYKGKEAYFHVNPSRKTKTKLHVGASQGGLPCEEHAGGLQVNGEILKKI